MTRDDITRIAREAGFVGFDGDNGSLRRFAALVAAAEREACAKVCEDDKTQAMEWTGNSRPGGHFAAAIRARGQE
jgi:hypothetical protein